MKAKQITAIVVLLALMLTCCLVACDPKLTDEPLKGTLVADFTKGKSDAVFESDGWTNGSVFNVVWTKENVRYGTDAMHLGITKENYTVQEQQGEQWVDKTYSYTAGEARTALHYGYGDFEVSMKPAKKEGTASTFFTCTGPYDTGLDGEPQKHDEIDIEFLGKDTTKVQFNYFVNGKGEHEYMYNLGFDASKEYHTYGFRWTKDYIVWFVDGKPVYKVEASENNPLPSAPGRMLMNYWCGTKDAEGWMGKYTDGNETADYQWIKTSATGVDLTPEVDPGEGFTGDWSTIDNSELTFSGHEKYTVTNENGVSHVTYTEVKGNEYINVNAPITTEATEKNWLHLTLKNNATTDVQVRVNVIDDVLVTAKAQNVSTNIAAFMDGVAVRTDLDWGGSFFDIPAGATVEAEINFAGTADSLELMIDSSRNDGTSRAGDVTISNVKFAKQGEIVEVKPDVPDYGSGKLSVNGKDVNFEGNASYTVSQDEGAVKIAYKDLSGKGYTNLTADISGVIGSHNVLNLTIKNNGENTAKVRIDVIGDAGSVHGDNNYVNLSASYTGDVVDKGNDYIYGGADWVQISAGGTVNCSVVFQTEVGAHQLTLYIDSSTYNDEGTHTGEIVLSDMSFTTQAGPGYELGKEHTTSCETIVNAGKDNAQDDKWMLWWVQGADWGCGSVVTMQDGWNTYNDGVNFSYTGGDKNFSVQLFYKNTSLLLNKQYVLKCTINASTAMDITVNGKAVSLTNGDNDVEVLFTNGILIAENNNMYAVDIQFQGTSDNVSFCVKNVKWYEISTEEYPSTPGGRRQPIGNPHRGLDGY